MRKHALLMITVALSFWGCVTFDNHYYRLGAQAEINRNWDEAISYYEKAIVENPKEYVYKMALARVKFSASLFHYQEARKLVAAGNKEEGLKEYEKAQKNFKGPSGVGVHFATGCGRLKHQR